MNNILLRGMRIIVPVSLQKHTIKMAHQGHQGLCKTKSLLLEHVWFPRMDKLVKEEIDQCIPCQATGQPNPLEPLHSVAMPDGLWEKVNIDFKGALPSGQYLLVIIDSYSLYTEVEIVSSTAAQKVIPKIDIIFSRHRIPQKAKSDNGPLLIPMTLLNICMSLGWNTQHQHCCGLKEMPR